MQPSSWRTVAIGCAAVLGSLLACGCVARRQVAKRRERPSDADPELAERRAQEIRIYALLGCCPRPRRSTEWWAFPTQRDLVPTPIIRGKVTGVDRERGLVIVSQGRNAGLMNSDTLIVSRGRRYVGRLLVDEVFPDVAAARYLLLDMKHHPQPGDDVATRPPRSP